MPRYQVVFTENAVADINKLDAVVKKRLGKKLDYFRSLNDPLAAAEKLVSSKIGSYRWRVGDYRIVFDVKDSTINILRVRHRRDVYRNY